MLETPWNVTVSITLIDKIYQNWAMQLLQIPSQNCQGSSTAFMWMHLQNPKEMTRAFWSIKAYWSSETNLWPTWCPCRADVIEAYESLSDNVPTRWLHEWPMGCYQPYNFIVFNFWYSKIDTDRLLEDNDCKCRTTKAVGRSSRQFGMLCCRPKSFSWLGTSWSARGKLSQNAL